MAHPSGYWTKERVAAEAAKYETRSKFHDGCTGAYVKARKSGILNEVCAHMERKPIKSRVFWTKEQIAVEAVKYKTRHHFLKGNNSAYNAARKLGALDEVCAHMVRPNKPKGYWTTELIAAEAAKYETRGQFSQGHIRAYTAAVRSGVLDEVCSNMERGVSGFDMSAPAIFYYLRVDTDTAVLYKGGITNRTVELRFSVADLKKITVLETVHFDTGAEAHAFEQDVMKTFADDRVERGLQVLERDGNTELFTRDVLGLDK